MSAGPASHAYENLIAAGRAELWRWRLEEALALLDAALRLRPDSAGAHYLRGETLFLQRRLDEALDSHAKAASFGVAQEGIVGEAMSGMVPGDFAWMSHMLRGDFAAAWRLADADRERRERAGIGCAGWPRHLRPVWDGQPLDGRKVLVRCYHGLGDTIQFIRYVPLLARRAAAVTVEAQPELLELFATLPGIDGLHALSPNEERRCDDLGCDAEIDVTELPHAFRTTLATIPNGLPLFRAEPSRLAAARRRLAAVPGQLKIGLVWAAGAWKPERSIALECLARLGAIPGVAFVNLQRGPEYGRWLGKGGAPAMLDMSSDQIADTAAAISALHLVITVDTMVAHLAGSLGVPVWLMLHFAADWRWLLERNDSPWYPTMRLFRQPAPGDWDSVVANVSAALSAVAAGRPTSPPRPLARVAAPGAGVGAPPRR